MFQRGHCSSLAALHRACVSLSYVTVVAIQWPLPSCFDAYWGFTYRHGPARSRWGVLPQCLQSM
jgi:hypothetical protein